MKNSKFVLSLLLILAVSLSCKLVDRFRSGGVVSGDYNKVAGNLPNYDPKDPAPSPGAAALRELAELEPSVERLIRDVEAAERAALKNALAELRSQRGVTEQLSRPLEVKERKGSTLLVAKSLQAPVVARIKSSVVSMTGRPIPRFATS